MDAIVKLNVGGTLFVTAHSTLTWPGSDCFFSILLRGDRPSARDDETGAYFIDRDPKLFAVILNYLRTREVRIGDVLVHMIYLLSCPILLPIDDD
jgi:hypothetical protein